MPIIPIKVKSQSEKYAPSTQFDIDDDINKLIYLNFREEGDILYYRIFDYITYHYYFENKKKNDINEFNSKFMSKIKQDSILIEIAFLLPSNLKNIDLSETFYKLDLNKNLGENRGSIWKKIFNESQNLNFNKIKNIIQNNKNNELISQLINKNYDDDDYDYFYINYKILIKKLYNNYINLLFLNNENVILIEDLEEVIDDIYISNIKCLLSELLNDNYFLEHYKDDLRSHKNMLLNEYTEKIILPKTNKQILGMFTVDDIFSRHTLKKIEDPKVYNYLSYIKKEIYNKYRKNKSL